MMKLNFLLLVVAAQLDHFSQISDIVQSLNSQFYDAALSLLIPPQPVIQHQGGQVIEKPQPSHRLSAESQLAIKVDHLEHFDKRQITQNSNCGPGQPGLVYTNQYQCANGTFSESVMQQNYTIYTRCDDCGQTQSASGGPVNLAVTQAANCTSVCCPKTQQAPSPGCVCPLDKFGDACQFTRPFRCNPVLFNHDLSCSSLYASYDTVKQLYSNLNCTKFKSKSSDYIELSFRLDCEQSVPLQDNNADNSTQYNFVYWAKNDKVAITKNPNAFLQITIFNMFSIKSNNLFQFPAVVPANVVNGQVITYGINMSYINSLTNYDLLINYVAGGRLYFEVVMVFGQRFFTRGPYYKSFLDFDDLDFLQHSSNLLSPTGIGGVAVACIVLAILLVFGLVYYRRKKLFRHLKKRK